MALLFYHPDFRNYHPDYTALFEQAVGWLTSPIGSLAWDVLLQGLAIVITVTVIRRFLERREESRWRPTMQNLYFHLFSTAEFLVTALTPRLSCQSSVFMYYFGEVGAIPSNLTNCRAEFDDLSWEEFIEPASRIMRNRPQLLSDRHRQLDVLLGQSAAVLARQPELSRLVTRLNVQLDNAIQELDEQLGSTTAEDGPSNDAAGQVAIDTRLLPSPRTTCGSG